VTLTSRFVQQRQQPGPLPIRQIARIHENTLPVADLSAYSFYGSLDSFWTDSKDRTSFYDPPRLGEAAGLRSWLRLSDSWEYSTLCLLDQVRLTDGIHRSVWQEMMGPTVPVLSDL
jgi:hypothetical protein